MFARLISILSLTVFVVLLVDGSSIEPALIKGAAVFFSLIIVYNICRFFLSIIGQSSQQDQESTPGPESA
jgi:hypothetical protein